MLMKPGDKWILTLPSELAYGDRGSGSKIPGGSVLIFTLHLIEVQPSNSWMDMLPAWLSPQVGLLGVMALYFLSGMGGGAVVGDVIPLDDALIEDPANR
jgi:hypothetical protein